MWRSNQLSYRTISSSWFIQATWAYYTQLPYFSYMYKQFSEYKKEKNQTLVLSLYIIHCRKIVSRKEVFQPHLPVRLPCYDLAPVIGFALGRSLRLRTLGTPNSHGLTGGVYKARERIHRAMADARLLANPAS